MRLLSPADYGLVAISTAVLTLVTMVAELGFGAAIVQAHSPTEAEVRSVFGASIAFSAMCAIALAAIAPWLGEIYSAPQVAPLIQAASLTLVLTSVATVPDAFLRREMSFVRLSVIELAAGLLATVTTVMLALAGYGVWSLVLGPLAAAAMRTVLVYLSWRKRLWPSLNVAQARRMLDFGLKVAVSRAASFVFGQADVVIGARLLTKSELGTYSIAMHLALMPMTKLMSVLNTVAFPAIAEIARSDEAPLTPALQKGLRLVGHVVIPMLWGLGSLSPWLVPVLLGDSWAGAVAPLQLVCIALPLRLVSVLLSTAMQALGEAGVDLRNTLTGIAILPLCFLAGGQFGAVGLAAAWLAGLPTLMLLNLRRASVHLGFGVGGVARALAPPVVISLAMAAAIHLAAHVLDARAGTIVGVGVLALVGAGTYLASLWLFDKESARSLLVLFAGSRRASSANATG